VTPSSIRLGALAPLLAFGCATVRTLANPDASYATAHTEPARDFADAVARISQRQLQDDSVVAPGARSILLSHDHPTPRVFVLLHGFTDSPTQFLELGQRVFARGDNVYIPRLPHHADRLRRVRELGRVQAMELPAFGDSSIDAARGLGDTVIVVGLSAGGAIAAHLAQTRADVARALLIAPAIAAGLLSDEQEQGFVVLASKMPDIRRSEAPDSTRPEFIQGITTRGLAQVLRLGHIVHDASSSHAPLTHEMILLLNERDHTVSESAALDLGREWSRHGARVAAYRFPKSANLPHNVMEVSQRGGNLELVLPVVEALAFDHAPPEIVHRVDIPCDGFRCALLRFRP
jgi:esterase/lipase